MCVIVEVLTRGQRKIWLYQNESPSRAQHPTALSKEAVDLVVFEVLQKIACQHGTHRLVGEHREVSCVTNDCFNAGGCPAWKRLADIYGHTSGRLQRVR